MSATKKTEWSGETRQLLEVRRGDVELFPCGTHTHCKICGRSHRTRRKFDDYNLRVHLQNETHLLKKAAMDNTLIRLRKGIEK